ncbi:hypothetical protein ATO13_03070 [Stappia sp. 22II-S9-Z10]|nr:hypothetical protein ATO13_03070 [Stappia sp. 22II-S9-Z10]
MNRFFTRIEVIIAPLERLLKVAAALSAALAILAFFIPSLGTATNLIISSRFGVNGYVYYEVAKTCLLEADRCAPLTPASCKPKWRQNCEGTANQQTGLTKDGQLFLLSPNRRKYDSISRGDRLQAASGVYFRSKPTNGSPAIFILQTGQCVIVTGFPLPRSGKEFGDKFVSSGGWLKVATTGCRLFN